MIERREGIRSGSRNRDLIDIDGAIENVQNSIRCLRGRTICHEHYPTSAEASDARAGRQT